MPRGARCLIDGAFYHILNRGNAKRKVFHDIQDYTFFLSSVIRAKEKHPVDVFAYCLMPNHFHFVISADISKNISNWTQVFMTRFILKYRGKYKSIGHIWQGRYKDFLIQNEDHLMVVIRYVERNPVQAGIVNSALDWKWSSHSDQIYEEKLITNNDSFFSKPKNWTEFVNTPLSANENQKIKKSMSRQAPFGDTEWVESTCKQYGLEHTLRPKGRPWKTKINKWDCPIKN